MQIELKYFGQLGEATGKQQEFMPLEKHTTASALRSKLETRYPQLSGRNYRMAIAQQIASDDTLVTENMEVALLPPFSGG